ncbi:MAG: 3-coathanger stack domain-containing protein, partial [Ferruginibacter sp.]
GNSTRVIFRAGNEIVLQPPFTVYDGNNFRGYIGPCDSGPVPTVRGEAAVPFFMNQVDKGDETTLCRYGYLTIDQSLHGNIDVTIHAVKAGNFLLIVTDKESGEMLPRISETMETDATILKPLNMTSIPKGKYYAQLYYNGKLAHVQELFYP